MKIFDVAIIGGGASGLATLISLIKHGVKNVVLFESNDRVGKKLIATGNGQGNLTNDFLSVNNYHSNVKDFCKTAIEKFDNLSYKEFLYSLGILTVTDEVGRVYPASKQATSVLDNMRLFLDNNGANILTGKKINNVNFNGEVFSLGTVSNDRYLSKRVVLATGGKASPNFGSDGSGYIIAKNFSHKITELNPSLTRLKTDDPITKSLKNIKETAIVKAFDGDRFLYSKKGEVLFSDFCLSGSAIFYASAYLARAKDKRVSISLLPDVTEDKIADIINKRKSLGYIAPEEILNGLVHKTVARAIYKRAKSIETKALVKTLKNFDFFITGDFSFTNAQVTSGGVSCRDVNENSLESKLQKGLYFTGEILDVDGDCGGYNLQWAYSSSMLVAKSIAKSLGVK